MKTSWERYEGRRHEYIHVNYNEIVVGHDYGTGMSDTAGCCSHQDFLNSQFQGLIEGRFGKGVLGDLIHAVKHSGENPDFISKKKHLKHLKDFIDSIPIDYSMKTLENNPKNENGYFNYGNAGGFKSIVKSDSRTLVESDKVKYIGMEDGEKLFFNLPGICSSIVELNDYFFVVHSDNFSVISPQGKVLFTTCVEDYKEAIFG